MAGIHYCPFEQWCNALPNMILDITKNCSSLVQNHCLGTYVEIIFETQKTKIHKQIFSLFCDKMTLGEL